MSSSNPFVKARIPFSDALVAASILALSAKKRTFTAREIVDLVRKAGDSRSESTIQNKVRVLLKEFSRADILNVFQAKGRRKVYDLAISKEDLERYMPSWVKNRYEEIVREIEKGEIVVKKEEEERKMAVTFTLDQFFTTGG